MRSRVQGIMKSRQRGSRISQAERRSGDEDEEDVGDDDDDGGNGDQGDYDYPGVNNDVSDEVMLM